MACPLPIAFWPFVSGGMLLWGLAAVAPLLIHLWSRRRYDEVSWAAVSFLLQAVRKNARRWRIEQLLLLAIRMAILILLAVALADPVLAPFTAASGVSTAAGHTHHIVVVDVSYSMDYRHADQTRLDRAKQWATERVRASHQGDGFSLVRLAAPPQVVVGEPVFDRQDILREIAELRRGDGGGDLLATLAELDRLVDTARSQAPRLHACRIAIFSDLGRTTWDAVTRDAARAVLARLEQKADIEVFDVGEEGGRNLAVTSLAALEAVVTVGQPVRLDVELQSWGEPAWTRHPVDLLIDGQRVASETVDVPATGRAQLSFVHRFAAPGDAVVEVRLGDDALSVDNVRWLVLPVRSELEVLCVEGQAGGAKHILLALEPEVSSLPRIRASAHSEIALVEDDLRRYDCVVLCNIGRFGREEARLLRAYLQQGGGLLYVLGDQIQPANYNRMVGAEAGRVRTFPAVVRDPVPLGEYAFDPLDYQHPIVAPFRDHQRSGLLTTPVWKYVPLALLENSAAVVALAFDTQDPAVVEEPIGRGRVVVLATDASSLSLDRSTTPPTPWSALVAWPSFPPLAHELLRATLGGQTTLRNIQVGGILRAPVRDPAETSVVVTDPAGRSQRLRPEMAEDVTQWTLADTHARGVYSVRGGNADSGTQRFAVNVDTRESRLDRFDARRLPPPFRAPTSPVDEGATILAAVPNRLYRVVLSLVLVLLVADTILAWHLGRRSL